MYVCRMPYAMCMSVCVCVRLGDEKMEMNSSNIFSYKFMRLVTKCETLGRKNQQQDAHAYAPKYEILYDNQKQRWNPVRNHSKRWACPMCVCERMQYVCKVDIEQSGRFQYFKKKRAQILCRWSQRNRLVMRLVYGSIFCFFRFICYFSAHRVYLFPSKAQAQTIWYEIFAFSSSTSHLPATHSKCSILNGRLIFFSSSA